MVMSTRPTWFKLMALRHFLPYLMRAPLWIRRAIVNTIPSRRVRKVRNIVEVMDKTSKEVLHAKKAALEAGDEQIALQVGEGARLSLTGHFDQLVS